MAKVPAGYKLLRSIGCKEWSCEAHRAFVLVITFFAYACYHVSRKSTSIVKSVLVPGACSSAAWSVSVAPDGDRSAAAPSHCGAGWAPFDGADGTSMLGVIDVAFLACYAVGMFFAGHLGDRFDLRVFLAAGMIGSGITVALFGMGYFWGVHAFGFYLAMQVFAGITQASGWPSVVAVVGNWFWEARRGFIMGMWNAHTSFGNIVGSLLAASLLQYGWGWSFIVPGALIACYGVLVYLFLMPYPEDVGCDGTCDYHRPREIQDEGQEQAEGAGGRGRAVGIFRAFCIPGVRQFALCLFFSKLVAYTFLYWLPFYLSQTAIGGEYLSVKSAGNLSSFFDVGGIIGGILAGLISDKLNSRAITAAGFMYLAIPSLYAYHTYGNVSWFMNIILMMISGLFVNGPYALITTAVSADLGTHNSLKGDSRALATVTAIIDGTGSLGAALGPLFTGYLSRYGWIWVFRMLMTGAFISASLLLGLVRAEMLQLISYRSALNSNAVQQGAEGTVARPLLVEDP